MLGRSERCRQSDKRDEIRRLHHFAGTASATVDADPYGFVNSKAAEYITPERLAVLPTAPEIRDELYVYNAEWWADNRDPLKVKRR